MAKRLPLYIRELIDGKKSLRIDLGCGANKMKGTLGIDARNLPGVDIVHDLETFPWPLPDNCARVAFLSHFWEHIKPWLTLKFMAELHRVCQHEAQVLIAAPYATEFRFVQDPTHCNPTNEATFCYWDKSHPSGLWHVYTPPVFHLMKFDILPAGTSRDFNAFLWVCKVAQGAKWCDVCQPRTPAAAAAPSGRGDAAKRGRTTRRAVDG